MAKPASKTTAPTTGKTRVPSKSAPGFTVRLSNAEKAHFQNLAKSLGLPSAAAAFKNQALLSVGANPFDEIRHAISGLANQVIDSESRSQSFKADLDAKFSQLYSRFDAITSLQSELHKGQSDLAQAVLTLSQKL